jgi:hypothetical protein
VVRLADTFDFGDKEQELENLLLRLNRMYTDIATSVNSKPDLYQRQVDGQVGDTFLSQGSVNINLLTNKVEMLTNHDSATTVIWTTLS